MLATLTAALMCMALTQNALLLETLSARADILLPHELQLSAWAAQLGERLGIWDAVAARVVEATAMGALSCSITATSGSFFCTSYEAPANWSSLLSVCLAPPPLPPTPRGLHSEVDSATADPADDSPAPLPVAAAALAASGFLLPATHWQLLRVEAARRLVGAHDHASSTFGANASTEPWGALEFAVEPALLLGHRLLPSPAFLFDGRFDVLLRGDAVCELAIGLAAVAEATAEAAASSSSVGAGGRGGGGTSSVGHSGGGHGGGPRPRGGRRKAKGVGAHVAVAAPPPSLTQSSHLQDDGPWRLLTALTASLDHHIRGISIGPAVGPGPEGHSNVAGGGRPHPNPPSAFWTSVFAVAADTAAVDGAGGEISAWLGSHAPSSSLRAVGVDSAASGATPADEKGYTRRWSTAAALEGALRSVQAASYSAHTPLVLHDRRLMMQAMSRPSLAALYPHSGSLYRGVAARDTALINEGFNPPASAPLAGTYLTAFNVVITPSGSLQTVPPEAEGGSGGGGRRGGNGRGGGNAHSSGGNAHSSALRLVRLAAGASSSGGGSGSNWGSASGGRAGSHADSAGSGGVYGPGAPPPPIALPFFAKTTCEGVQADALPRRARSAWSALQRGRTYAEVVVLTQRFEWNVYHWTAEALGKLGPVLDYVRAHPHVKLHLMDLDHGRAMGAKFRAEQLALLGIDYSERVVTGYVRARVVHVPDNYACSFPPGLWAVLLREGFRAALLPGGGDGSGGVSAVGAVAAGSSASLGADQSAEADSSTTPPALIQSSEEEASPSNASSSSPASSPRRGGFFRRRTYRRITNELALLERLRRFRGVVAVDEIRDWELPSQAAVLRTVAAADVIVGAHGAGLANLIVARPGACVMEVMPYFWFVGVYMRLSGHLGLGHNIFVVPGRKLTPITVEVGRVMAAVKQCVKWQHAEEGAAVGGEGGSSSGNSAEEDGDDSSSPLAADAKHLTSTATTTEEGNALAMAGEEEGGAPLAAADSS